MPDLIDPFTTVRPPKTPVVFLDTEFTGLTGEPLLLSVGMVGGPPNDQEFYAEVTDEAHLGAASPFVSKIVLPQFGKVGGAACTYVALGAKVAGFLDGMASRCRGGRRLSVAFESDHDWALIEGAIRYFNEQRWLELRKRLQPFNVYNTPGFTAGERAASAYFDSQRLAPLSRHHALCDARALRIFCEAAAASTVPPARPDPTLLRSDPYRPLSPRTNGKSGLSAQSAPSHERP